MDQDMSDRRRIIREIVNSGNDSVNPELNSSNSDNGAVMEMAIVIISDEEEKTKACVSGENRDSIRSDMVSKVLDLNDEKQSSCGENLDGEWICRICQLSSDQSSESTNTKRELIQLGCGCKDELGCAHLYCAEAWFKLKGDRLCEICGETAKNVTGVGDNRFIEEWNDRRSNGTGVHSSERTAVCWGAQPLCNFLMACLVVAFVIPWFLRVNMF